MIPIVGWRGIGAMKGNEAAGALASCRHTTKRWSGEGLPAYGALSLRRRFPGGGQGRNTLSRRFVQGWGLKTRRRAAILPWEREYARIKIDGLVGGNPDFTNAPAHADDDARFHDRQQACVHAGGG